MDHPPEQLDRNPDRTLTYGPHPDQVVDVYAGGSAGRVTLIHGGFWKPAYDRAHLAPMAIALADNGFEVALVEYRRPETGRWPVISADVRAALATHAHMATFAEAGVSHGS